MNDENSWDGVPFLAWWNSAHVLSVISNGIETQAEINESGWRKKKRERERGHRFFRGNIESKINHAGSKRWRAVALRRIEAAVEKKWALSINYCPIQSSGARPASIRSNRYHSHSARLRFYDSRSIFSRNNVRVVRFIYPRNPLWENYYPLDYEFIVF